MDQVSKSTRCLTPTETIRLMRDGEKEGEGYGGGGNEREIIHLSLHCHYQNDSCIVNCAGQSHKTLTTDHNFRRERRSGLEPKSLCLPAYCATVI